MSLGYKLQNVPIITFACQRSIDTNNITYTEKTLLLMIFREVYLLHYIYIDQKKTNRLLV